MKWSEFIDAYQHRDAVLQFLKENGALRVGDDWRSVLSEMLSDGVDPEIVEFGEIGRRVNDHYGRTWRRHWHRHEARRQGWRTELVNWCQENCSGRFCALGFTVWMFENPVDAVHFKLRWY